MRPWSATLEGGLPRPRAARRALAGMAAICMVALAACGSSSSHSSSSTAGKAKGSTYTIHAIVSLTGSASFLGGEEKTALDALAKEVNSTGGVDGHPIAFDVADNQTNASVSVSLASPLIGTVPMLIVGSLTTTDRPVDALVTSNGPVIYDLSPGDHPARGSFVYSSGNSTVNQTQAFINFAEQRGWTRLGAITSTDASGQDGWNQLQKAVAGSGGKVTITDHETFAPNAASVTTQLAKIKSTNPQAIVVWTTGTPFSTVAKGMNQLSMDSIPTMTTNGNLSYKEMTGLAGLLPSHLYFPSSQFQAPAKDLTPAAEAAVKTFDQAMKAAGEKVPDEGNVLAWDPGLILVSALKKLGIGATASQIHNYIDSLTDFEGVGGTYDFKNPSVPDNRGLTIKSIYVVEWSPSADNWVAVSGPAGEGSA